jgi:hypothetical protein
MRESVIPHGYCMSEQPPLLIGGECVVQVLGNPRKSRKKSHAP